MFRQAFRITLVSRVFFTASANGRQVYLQLLEDTVIRTLIKIIENWEGNENTRIFQQDGAPSHYNDHR